MKVDKFKPISKSFAGISSYRLAVTILAFLFALGLAACNPWTRGGQTARTDFINLHPAESIGQTFTARYRGLSGIQLFLKPGEQSTGTLSLKLHPCSQDPQVIALSTLKAEDVRSPAYYHFYFEPQPSSNNHDYYFSLDFQGEGIIQVGTASGSSFLDGALYHNSLPLDLQTNFLLVYDPIQVVNGLIFMAFTWVWYLLISVFLFVMPGWVFLSLLWKRNQSIHWTEKAALSVGLSLAIYPVLYLWTNLIGLRLGYLYAVLPPSLSLIWLLWKASATFRTNGFSLSRNNLITSWDNQPDWGTLARHLPTLSLLVVLALVFAVRFWVIRTLDVPMWGDSYQHTMIAQLLVDNRGLFSSWQPYVELQTFTYHFGFHSLVAVFHYISHLPMPQATLWTGQILNGLAVFSLYPLANRLGGNRWAGVTAVLVAGLLTPMPMYYVNWGRYTQLAGLTILPIAVFFLWKAIESRTRDWGLIILSWIAMAGLAITHYRVLIFAVIFIIAFAFITLRRKNAPIILTNTFWIGFGAGLLFLPWFIHIFSGRIMEIFGSQIRTPASEVSDLVQSFNAIGDLFFFLPAWIWLLIPVFLGWGLWLRKQGVAATALWWLLILWAANPSWLGLPGEGALSNFAVFIASYIPAGLIIGAASGWVVERGLATNALMGRFRHVRSILIMVFIIITGTWSSIQRVRDLDIENHALVTRPDIRAASWMRENTSREVLFMVNSAFAYGNTLVVGTDAGWWLPYLAMRQTTLPPINYGSEIGFREDYLEWVNSLISELLSIDQDHDRKIDIFIDRGITNIYIGQQQGMVNNNNPILNPAEINQNLRFKLVYSQDRVLIFELRP
jgi:hypothetical protein